MQSALYFNDVITSFLKKGELLRPVRGKGVTKAEVILLDSSVEQDQQVLEAMEEWTSQLADYQIPLANTTVLLQRNGSDESNLGNLVTDAMKACTEGATLAIQNNGGIRSDLIIGDITLEDIFAVLPFNNTVDKVCMFFCRPARPNSPKQPTYR